MQNPKGKQVQLHTGDPKLVEFIRATIRERGPVSFAWFMEQALYHPEYGYYSSGRAKVGRQGDYFTNVSVGPVFGRLLAAQFEEMWLLMGAPPRFTIVEQGADSGDLARDVLLAVQQHASEFFAAVRYVIIEPFPALRTIQTKTIAALADRVSWCDSLDRCEPFSGVHFSNELLDAMPVHLIESTATPGKWNEKLVTDSDDGFTLVTEPLGNARVRDRVARIPTAPEGYTTEINTQMLWWVEQVRSKLRRGFVLTVDYGYPRGRYYHRDRTMGTLATYQRHRRGATPLEYVGLADITAHVDWTSLIEAAEAVGLEAVGYADQHHFVAGFIAGPFKSELEQAAPEVRRGLQTLLHPGLLGMNFQVVAFSKDVIAQSALTAFRFAGEWRNTIWPDEAE